MSEFEIAKRLRDCLLHLVEGKVSERKKQADDLKSILSQPLYLQYLNRNSVKKKNGSQQGGICISWKNVFSKIKAYIEQESQKFKERENSGQNLSATVRTNIMKEKRKCSDLFRSYVKAIKCNQQYDMAKPVTDHILAVLHDSFARIAFGSEYSVIFTKYILSDTFMCLKIPASDIDDATWFYCKIIKNPPLGWDRGPMTQVLLHLLNVRSNLGAWEASKLLDFFTFMFDAVKSEKVSSHHENLLRSLLLVCRALGVDHRLRFCQLGESILLPLLQLWKTRPSETCSELMLEFVSFQLALHHPKGAVCEEKGARAHDWTLWKSHLLSLYKVVVVEIDELCEKNKYSSSKETILKPLFISVVVEVCAQVFVDTVGVLDITQMPSTFDGSLPSKKRRIEVCFRTMTDSLSSSKIVPWLQVISAFLLKYPDIVSVEEAENLLDILIDINLSCNQFETKNWLLTCFQSFVQAFGVKKASGFVEINFSWQRLWDLAVKSVALMHQCQEAAHKLLTTLLFHKLVSPKIEFCNLYAQGSSNRITSASLRTLSIFLEKCPSPSPIDVCYQNSIQSSKNILRFENQVMEWLFTRKSDDNSPFQVLSIDTDASTIEEFARVLALLCLKNSDLRSNMRFQSSNSERVKWISDMEKQLMLITFDLPMSHLDAENENLHTRNISQGVLCAEIWEKILSFFIGASSSVFQEQTTSNQVSMSPIFIKHASLLFEMLQVFYFQGAIKDKDWNSNHFVSYLKRFLNSTLEIEMQNESVKLTGNSVVLLLKDFLKRVVVVFKNVWQQYDQNLSCHNFITSISNAIPPDILKHLLRFSLESVSEMKSLPDASTSFPTQTLNSSHSHKKNKYAFDYDDLDDEDDCFEINMEVEDSVSSTDSKNPTEGIQQQVQCLEILGEYCSFITSTTQCQKPNSFPEFMIKKLMSILSTFNQFFKNVDDVHLVLVSLKCVLLNKCLEDGVIGSVISTLKLLLNQFSIMQDLCISVMELCPLLFHHLIQNGSNQSPDRLQHKSHMLHLLRILSKKELDRKGSSVTSFLMAKSILTMLKIESSITWAVEKPKSNDCSSDHDENAVISSFAQFLASPFVTVRLFVASNIHAVISTSALDSVFDFASSELSTFLCTEQLDFDDCVNRVSSFFRFMCHVILHFPCLEKEALFAICKTVHSKRVDQCLVAKVLAQLSTRLGYESSKSFLELHLVYIFYEWFQAKFDLKEFPFMVLGVDSFDQFIIDFFRTLVPVLFFMEDMTSISMIAEKLHLRDSEIIFSCLPTLQAKILSDFTVASRQKNGNKFRTLLSSIVPPEVSEKSFLVKLDEFVVSLLAMLKNNQGLHLQRCQANNVHSVKIEEFSSTISHVISSTEYRGSFLGFLHQKPDRIQSILLSLNIKLSKTVRPHEGGDVLFMYQSFLELLCAELGPDLNCSCFVIKEVIYTIINFLSTKGKSDAADELLVMYCCDILQLLCSKAVVHFKEVIGDFLPFIVSSLTSFVNETESGQKVLSFLSFLIIDCQERLAEYILFLDPFPEHELFQNLRCKHNHVKYKNGALSLEQEISLFLKSCKMMGKATVEGLHHLFNQLVSRQTELLEMLNMLKGKILFSEEVKNSVLHQLVCQLASICAQDTASTEVQKAASNCMGAIGPVAFSSVVLQPSSNTSDEGLNSLQQSYTVILNLLTEYLFNKSIDIKVKASAIMKELFGTKTAYSFFIDYQTLRPDNPLQKYALPFFACQNVQSLKSVCQFSPRIESIKELCIWLPETVDHTEWITTLVCIIIESGLTRNNFYECLIPICKIQVHFCEKLLPYLIHAILLLDDEETKSFISSGIDLFFSNFSLWVQSTPFKNGHTSSPVNNTKFSKASVRTMLAVLNHIWLNPRQEPKDERNILKDFWLNISFLEVAQAAQYCSAYFTAVLYTELWCDKMREKSRGADSSYNHSDSSESLDCSPLSFIGSRSRDQASLVYDILLDTYSQIGDSDAISGCEVVATDSQAILKHSYLVENKWDGLLKISDLNNSHMEILQALQQNHLNSVLQGYIQSLMNTQDQSSMHNILEYQCESAWRMGQWDLSIPENSVHGFQELLYKSQQSLITENNIMLDKFINMARETQFEYLSHTSLEAARNILPFLSHIQMLSVLEDFSKVQSNPDSLHHVLKSWDLQEQMPYEDFDFVEPVSWLKCVLLKQQVDANSSRQFQARGSVITELKKLLEKHAIRARKELHLEVASKAIHILRKIPCLEEEDILRYQMEEAKILWTKKEYSIANKILKSSLPYMEKFAKENPKFLMYYGQALTLRGRWLAETCNENSAVIMRDYLEKALDVLKNLDDGDNKDWSSAVCDAYLAVARYADGQYQSIINYKKSTAYQTKQVNMASSREKAKQLKTKDITDDQRKLILILTRQTDIDQEEVKAVEADRKRFLENAITNYLQCLKGSDTHDLWIFRLVSLWFQNLDVEEINRIIKDKIQELHTYKFLPLMYQLAARMGTQASNVFTNTLLVLIKKISVDHPHHALPVILALNNADKDPADTKEVTDQTVHLQQAEVPAVKERMNTAKKILSILLKTKVGSLVKSYSDLCDAYITLAYLPVKKNIKRGVIPKAQPLLKFRNLENIPIITEDVKVDRSCGYTNITGLHAFHSEFRMCGGITLPKVIKCVGKDGIEREQLVKGRDDLRQDAVMQQVFCLVNCLLQEKMETRQRKLHIRTYKVVPVSRRSGVLQWCEGTQVLSQYLVGPGGAHTRYYPKMATPIDCRKKMMTIAGESQLPKKRQIYDSICADFPPVFRYFFLENFPEPSAWFERRQSYTKSVAASSIVGYILGLGDRHVNNILIDKNTAEVVHIDFGIAFEKGRILATPETVPFRLTRDIVDGMGINGVEGTFKRCSEKTLEVMRNSQDVLLTILEVLLHDPLYEWAVPACKSSQRSSASSNSQTGNEVNTLAERALMRLQQKLQGLEEGVAMSAEGQVNLLIQQARDPNNLCRIYAGWQPYL